MNSLSLKANYINAPDARPLEASSLPRGVHENQSQLAYITTSAHSTACESHTFIYLFALMPVKLNTGCAQFTKGHCNLPVKMNAGLRATSVWVVIKVNMKSTSILLCHGFPVLDMLSFTL